MITLSSIFREASGHLERYMAQVDALRQLVDVRLVLGEGDSTDHTGDMLRDMVGPRDTVVTVNHGGPMFGSVDHPQRWQQIAQVVRGVVAMVDDPGNAYVWMEGDLIWDPYVILGLLDAERCVAPMIFASDQPNRLYDIWGARQDGEMFSAMPPYFPKGTPDERYVKVDSCGSCFVVPGADMDVVRNWGGVWPFPAGGKLWMDTLTVVTHP